MIIKAILDRKIKNFLDGKTKEIFSEFIKCSKCNQLFYSKNAYLNHKCIKNNLKAAGYCEACKMFYMNLKNHKCKKKIIYK